MREKTRAMWAELRGAAAFLGPRPLPSLPVKFIMIEPVEPVKIDAEEMIERQATAHLRALERHARQQAARVDPPAEREWTTQEFSHSAYIKVIQLLHEGRPMTSKRKGVGIDELTGLDGHLIAKIRDHTLGRGYVARAGQSPSTVVLVRIPKTAH
jgi:hypothetical protein